MMFSPRAWGGQWLFRSVRSASTLDEVPGLLATQTFTFLFTDIEGSTALLQLLGRRMRKSSLIIVG
jgi:hypothetical protein